MVSDAGMPGISDPGADLVALALEAQIPVTVIPGPSASLSGLVLSGFSTKRFAFEGFLPLAKKDRKSLIMSLKSEERTIVLYEAPHRLLSLLQDLYEILGDRRIAIARELTKIYEEVLHFTLEEAVRHYKENTPQGEFVVILKDLRNVKGISAAYP